MITDPDVFDDAHVPRELMHREGEVETISTALAGARDDRAEHVLVWGPSGVGKTVLSKHVARRLERQRGVPTTHIRCMGATRGAVCRHAIEGHPDGPDSVPGNTPVADCEGQLREVVAGEPYVLLLDEADDLPATEITETLLDVEGVTVVVICHDHEDWLARAAPRVQRAMGRALYVERFGVTELANILEARADAGLKRGAVTRDRLERIADRVAGVARRGIQSLRAAAELAFERGHSRITEADIDDCFDKARTAIRRSNLSSLTYHHQLIYHIIHDRGDVSSRAIHEWYDAHADALYREVPQTPVSKRHRRSLLDKLQSYDLVGRGGEDNHPMYHLLDAEVEPAIEVPAPAE